MFTLEGIVNKLEVDVHILLKCQTEEFKSEKSLLVGHLLLM